MNRHLIFSALLLLVSTTVSATIHTIRFGGGFGNTYEPKKLNVAAGDTIIWRGDFSTHPFSSTSVPAGAESFSHSAGPGITAFTYVVKVAGDYAYKCDVHGSTMNGTFTAAASAVEPVQSSRSDVHVFTKGGEVKLRLQLAEAARVSARLLDHLGRTLSELTTSTYPAGSSEVTMDAHHTSSGIYFLDVRINGEAFVHRLAVIR